MPWMEQTTMSMRTEFCRLAVQDSANLSELCRRYGISRKTGYKWLERLATGQGLADQRRTPGRSPRRTDPAVEQQVLELRTAHPDEGGRKLRHRLLAAGVATVPAASTITAILHRHQQITPVQTALHQPVQRFEADEPNAWWQMDFKGPVAIGRERWHPLVVLDDRSRFVVGLVLCPDQQGPTVWAVLEPVFRTYGLPWAILCDNGAPWGSVQANGGLTTLAARLIRHGVAVWHGRPYHPQTQGKVERVNRTLGAAVLADRSYPDPASAQAAFDRWRTDYNEHRPHEALGMTTPLSQYRMSPRTFPDPLAPLIYEPGDAVRLVSRKGMIMYRDRRYYVGEGVVGQEVAVRATMRPGIMAIYFAHHLVREIALEATCG